ncbi:MULTISPECIES: hypothetical protein [unclassified Neisseria]|uniref:hypothetical protein n=1 Tax=unclassified Neisseria TaxID=2623750 RepID=UPI00266669FA|nr:MULTISPECIES: hypothetical protein [unclassified Neisseria]MDO1510957.1 hypothetical protein [Neisseria sp. MVDL19-042950]MDO1517203.1 hypothetical protein [Neisseria sp. MVDL18-041461]MDO1564566.1 hypothetical protein [Neisseria sp. MVDL20-010259]
MNPKQAATLIIAIKIHISRRVIWFRPKTGDFTGRPNGNRVGFMPTSPPTSHCLAWTFSKLSLLPNRCLFICQNKKPSENISDGFLLGDGR